MMSSRFFLFAGAALLLLVSPAMVQADVDASAGASGEVSPEPVPASDEKKDDSGEAGWGKKAYFKSSDGKFSLELNSRVQVRYTQADPDGGDSIGSFRIRRARLTMSGKAFEDWKYKIQTSWSGGSTTLEDAYFQYTKNKLAQLWVGQGKTYFGRQALTSSGKLQFVDRSIANARFIHGRDQGVGLFGVNESKTFEYNLGFYNGNGRNQSRDDNDEKLIIGRVVWTPFGEYKLDETSFDYPSGGKLALGVSALSNTEGSDNDVDRFGVEFAYKVNGFNTVGEYFSEESDADGDTDGFYVQLGYLFPNKQFEIAGRYAVISPDVSFDADEIETGVAFSYYLKKHDYKVQADFRNIEDEFAGTDDREIRLQLQISF